MRAGSSVSRGGVETLVEGPQGKRPPSFSLGTGAPRGAAVRKGVVVVAAGGRDVSRAEGHAQAHGHERVEHLCRDGGNEGPHGTGKELGDSEGLAGITAEGARLRCVEVGESDLVEAKVGPADEEAVDGKEEGRDAEQWGEAEQRDQTDVEQREAGNPQGEETLEEGYRMRRDELAEGDEERNLKGDGAANGHEADSGPAGSDNASQGGDGRNTYVHRSLRVMAKKRIEVTKQRRLGTRAVMSRNLANSREDQARSR